jgi:hypothetical protein
MDVIYKVIYHTGNYQDPQYSTICVATEEGKDNATLAAIIQSQKGIDAVVDSAEVICHECIYS